MHFPPKLVPLALLFLTPVAAAQLDLPGGSRPPVRDPAAELKQPTPPKGDLAPGREGTELELPAGANAPTAPANPAAAPALPAVDDDQRARQVFLELGAKGALELVPRSVERLLALDEAGRRAARAELASANAAHLLTAARTCLRAGEPADRAAVADRLTRAVPPEIAVTLLDDLLAADPVVASPEYLCSLLDHECAPLRHRAVQLLEPSLTPTCLPALAPRLASRRTPTRLLAVDLIARIDDPAATHLLVSRLGDGSAQVASRVASLLAARAGTDEELLGAAFPAPLDASRAPSALDWDRQRAYALLSLVEREEVQSTTLLDSSRVPVLLAGLDSALPIVAGSCAVALTAIGYRSPPAGPTSWLDREVPHALVRYGTGAVFHSDFSALATPALRAFSLLTGRSFGADGEAARGYWTVNADSFRARRGVIELGPDPTAQLAVSFDDARDGAWTILGTALEPRHPDHGCDRARCTAPPERSLFLDQPALERLVARLSSEGVFDVRRPPTLDDGPSGRWLKIEENGQEKHFSFPPGAEPEWFGGLLEELRAHVAENRWQLFFDPARYHSQRDWWLAERERFADDAEPLARRQAFKAVVLERALASAGAERSQFVTELEGLFDEVGVPEGRDFAPLLELVRSERGPGPRLETLLGLARVAAALARADASAAPGEKDPVHELFWAGVDRGGEPLRPALERVARDLAAGAGQELAQDVRPFVRSLAPAALAGEAARGGDGASAARARLVALLSDTDPAVVQATLTAIGEQPFEEARAALTGIAREGQTAPRALALRAMGRLQGPEVLDLVLVAMAEPEEELQSAAVEALADLGDPRSASLCASLLSRGSASPLFEPARRALVRLGPAGEEECLRLARSASARSRREAVLFLAQQGLPEAASLLLTLLTEDPTDSAVAWELAVLSATDLRATPDPVRGWWAWWDLVVQDDALAWLLAASERAGFPAPPRAQLVDPTDVRGAHFLVVLLGAKDQALAERAARELERRLGQPLGRPASESARADWRSEVATAVEAHFAR